VGGDYTIAAQAFLVLGHHRPRDPFLGLELLDIARGVAEFNLPARAGQLFGVSLLAAARPAQLLDPAP
jgi:hypothetical protein